MGFEAGFSDGGPASALAVVAGKLDVPTDLQALRERFFACEAPHSLKALVQVAGEIGLDARAFRAEIENLDDVLLPAIVHLNDRDREENGFAVLVDRAPDAYHLEEGVVPEPHHLTRREFERLWSGIVVTFERGAGAAPFRPRHAGLLWRAGRWFRGGDIAARVHEVSFRVALAGCGLLAFVAAVRLGTLARSLALCLGAASAVVATLVAAVAARMLYEMGRRSLVPTATPRLASKLCRHGTLADCEGVLSTRYASIFGIDLSSIGLAFFASNLLLLSVGAVLPGTALRALFVWLAAVSLLALPGALWLIGVQIYPLRRLCTLCMTCHAGVLVCAVLGTAFWLGEGRAVHLAEWLPFAALHALACAAALGLLVPYLGLGLETRAHRARLGWIAATPWGALAEMLGRPRAAHSLPTSAFRIGSADAPFRLDAVVHPNCPGCGPVVDKVERLVSRHASLVTCVFHIPPRDLLRRGDVALCEALYATSRVAGGDKALALFRAAKAEPWRMISEAESDPGNLLERFAGDRRAAESALETARGEVRDADALYQTLQRGTPTVLLNGKPWESSLEDLDLLLSRYPDLLAALLRVSSRSAETSPPATGS